MVRMGIEAGEPIIMTIRRVWFGCILTDLLRSPQELKWSSAQATVSVAEFLDFNIT